MWNRDHVITPTIDATPTMPRLIPSPTMVPILRSLLVDVDVGRAPIYGSKVPFVIVTKADELKRAEDIGKIEEAGQCVRGVDVRAVIIWPC